MNEEEYRSKTIALAEEKLEIERHKLTVEKNIFRNNIGGFITAFVTILVMIIGLSGIRTYQDAMAQVIVERKLDAYLTYLKIVNQSWAQYAISQSVDITLRQKGIDAFEELRVISSDDFVERATTVNGHFAKLYPPFEITETETSAFNDDFVALKEVARLEFVVFQNE